MIQAPTPRKMTIIDVETEAIAGVAPERISSPTHKMDLLRRSQADELFTLIEPSLDQIIRERLEAISDQILNLPREQYFRALDKIPKRFA